MTGPLATAVLTLPRAGHPALDLAAARAAPGVLAVVEAPTNPAGKALPAGRIVAALAAVDAAALHRGMAALACRSSPGLSIRRPRCFSAARPS